MDNSDTSWGANLASSTSEFLITDDDFSNNRQYLERMLSGNAVADTLHTINNIPADVMQAFLTSATSDATTATTMAYAIDASTASQLHHDHSIIDFMANNEQNDVTGLTPPSSHSSILPSAKTGKGRKAFACEICRKRKVRCDLLRPNCSNCQKRNTTCVYRNDSPSARRMLAQVSGDIADRRLASRALSNKRFTARKASRDERQATPPEITLNNDQMPVIPLGSTMAPDFCSDNVMTTMNGLNSIYEPIWLQSPSMSNASSMSSSVSGCSSVSPALFPVGLGQHSGYYEPLDSPPNSPPQDDADDIYGGDASLQFATAKHSPSASLYMDLPPDLVQHLVTVYVTENTFQIAYFTVGWLQKELLKGGTSHALTYAMMSLACRSNGAMLSGIDTVALETAMTNRAADILAKDTSMPSLSTVQASLMLQVIHICKGNSAAAGRYHYKSLKLLQLLDLNTPLESDYDSNITEGHPDWDEMETRRRVWWMAYMLDRCISVATGNPSYLDHKHSRILFPDDDVDLEQGTAGTDEHTSTEYQDTAKKAGPFNWRARVLQLIELQSEAIQVSNQLRDSPPDMDKEVLRQRLHQIALTFNRLGGREKSLETMDRVRRITARLAYLPDSDNGVRALKAYKVLFRTFAHCLHRTLQIIIGRAQMSLLDLDSSGNSANLPKQGNNLTALFANRVDIEIRESIVQAAVEIAELTRLIPNDLLFCTNAFHSFNVGMAGFVFNDVANAPDNDRRHQWPGISRGDAVYHMESLVSCLDIMSNWYKTLTSRRDMLKVLLFKAQARLSPSLFGDLASQEILKTMPPIMDNTMRSSRVVVSMATPKLTTLSLASTSSVQAYPSIGMPIDENSIIYRPAHWDSNQLATTTINTVKSEQEITPPPEVNSNYQYSYNITSR